MIDEWWIGKDMERIDRGLIYVLSRQMPGNTEETSVRIVGIPAEIRTDHLPNTILERYLYTNLPVPCHHLSKILLNSTKHEAPHYVFF
jgi:hypothetical protein